MSFFSKTKQKRNNQQGFVSKMFPLSRKAVYRERREVAYAKKNDASDWGVMLLWLCLGATTAYILFLSPYLLVEDSSISGAKHIPGERLEQFVTHELSGKYLGLVPRNNFFTLRTTQLESKLKQEYPLLKKATVTRVFPNTLRVELEECEKIVTWCSQGTCFMLDDNGVITENPRAYSDENKKYVLSVTDASGQTVSAGQRLFDWNFSAFVISLEPLMSERLGLSVEDEFTTASRFSDELRVKTKDGWEIYLNTKIPLQKSLSTLALLFEKELSAEKRIQLKYVDLRTENRVYYAFQDGGQLEAAATSSDSEPSKTEIKKAENKKKE